MHTQWGRGFTATLKGGDNTEAEECREKTSMLLKTHSAAFKLRIAYSPSSTLPENGFELLCNWLLL